MMKRFFFIIVILQILLVSCRNNNNGFTIQSYNDKNCILKYQDEDLIKVILDDNDSIQAIVVKDRKGLNLIYNDFGPSGASYQIVNKNYENKTNVNLDQMNSIERYESINKISKTYIIDKDGRIIEIAHKR